ncbi:hypothetical protein M409DRAFT_17131 [Zasmidium cellare ATCC 36951]|uniref:Uncharacterized protein n=1 Tax=Zasmidium cellare ATCC 36951 TaxID=1080233 RepID=A0A6A6D693_ZASCE|nr:uncharacterized protein M409DRAFT_17131 [Zasmidium cellare ATCC 36951]KAF2173186.1 hypothetical protein M409DRAFT_17131 [Zasmidium cellare ATCC 36951]
MSTASSSRRPATTRSARSPESFDSLRTRDAAAEILQSYEKLSWFSFHRCETIMQTRQHFQRVAAGFDSDAEAKNVRWEEDFTRHPKSAEEEAKSSRKGKERVSLGGESGRKERNGSKSKDAGAATEPVAKES